MLLSLPDPTPPPSRFCNSCVYTTLALLRSLALSSNKATNIPAKSRALASCLSFPWCSFTNPKETWPHLTPGSCQSVSRNQRLRGTRGGTIDLCLFVLEGFQHWKKLFFGWFQTPCGHSCNLGLYCHNSFPHSVLTPAYCLKALHPEISKMNLLCLLSLLFARNHKKWLKLECGLMHTVLDGSGSHGFIVQ